MDKFEYVVALVAVITGVGLSDVALSLHRLLKRRAAVVWHWIPVTLALYASVVVMRLWYQFWSIHDVPVATGLPFVTVQTLQTLVLVLVAVAALPDEEDFHRGRIDLGAYYTAHWRYIWTMYLAFLAMWIGTGLYFRLTADTRLSLPAFIAFFGVPIVLTIAALVGGRRWHGSVVLLLVAHEASFASNLIGLRPFVLQLLGG